MAVPDYQSLMLPVLKVAAAGDITVPKAAKVVADTLGLSADDVEQMLPSGKQRLLHNRVHWAKFYMSKAGLIDTPARGVFRASSHGLKLLKSAPQAINVELLKTFPDFKAFYDASTAPKGSKAATAPPAVSPSEATPEEQVEAAHTVLHAALRSDLLQQILANTSGFFERVVVDLLVAMGYGGTHENAAMQLGKSGDAGVDGVIDEDRLGLDRVYVQAKRYAAHITVQRAEVQGFVGSLVGHKASKGVFVTTSSFTSGAKSYVSDIPQRVVLIDGERLTALMLEHDVGVRLRRTLAFKRLDEDYFIES